MDKPKLSTNEFLLMAMLTRPQGKLVTHKRIAIFVGRHIDPTSKDAAEFSKSLVSRLRRKIGFSKIRTVRGKGYYLK